MVHNKDKYKEESYCRECDIWVPEPTRKPINFGLATIKGPNEGNEYYYDVTGKRVGVIIILKIEELARRDIDGTLLQMIKEFVKGVKCPSCHKICSGGPRSKTGAKNHYIASDKPVGRPKGSTDKYKDVIDHYAEELKRFRESIFDYEDWLKCYDIVLYNKVMRKLEKENEGKESSRVT